MKEKTPVSLITFLGVCLFLVLMSSCSKEEIVDDDMVPDRSLAPEQTSVTQYVEAQNVMLQLFSTISIEAFKTALPISLSSTCPDTMSYDNGPGFDRGLILDFGSGCTVANGHNVEGKATLLTYAPSVVSATGELPAFIIFENDMITIDDYTFIIHKPGTSTAFDIKFFNFGTALNPVFAFRVAESVYFEMIHPSGEKTLIFPPWSDDAFLIITTSGINVSIPNLYDALYNATYDVKFGSNANNQADPFWQVLTLDANDIQTDELRVITAPGENLIIQPTAPWPLNGTLQCWTAPDFENNIASVIIQDLDFGSDSNGCNVGNVDSYVEVCDYEAMIDCTNTDCSIWELTP